MSIISITMKKAIRIFSALLLAAILIVIAGYATYVVKNIREEARPYTGYEMPLATNYYTAAEIDAIVSNLNVRIEALEQGQ